jgi:hypothetical protein
VSDSDVEIVEELIGLVNVDRSWMEHAACRGIHPNLFHSEFGDYQTQKQALVVCNGVTATRKTCGVNPCPVREQCLEYAMSLPPRTDTHGVYGGKTHKQRVSLRSVRGVTKGKPRSPCGTQAGYRSHLRFNEKTCDECRKANALHKMLLLESKNARILST